MAVPAMNMRLEVFVEKQAATLGANVNTMREDVSELKTDLRDLRKDVRDLDVKFSGKHDDLMRTVVDVKLQISEMRLGIERSSTSFKIWAILLYVALAAGSLGVLARGLKWI